MKKKLCLISQIVQGKFIYFEKNYSVCFDLKENKKLQKFKDQNEGCNVEIVFELIDSPGYFQHKYYRGYLLPDIAFASGEYDIFRQHLILKRDFLFERISSGAIEEIPEKHLKDGIFAINQKNLNNFQGVPCKLIKGTIIVIDDRDFLIGYIPSTKKLSYKEMERFLSSCENRLFIDLNGRIGEQGRDQEDAGFIRKFSRLTGKSIQDLLKENREKLETLK